MSYLKIVKILREEVDFQFKQTRTQFKFFFLTTMFSLVYYIFNFTMYVHVLEETKTVTIDEFCSAHNFARNLRVHLQNLFSAFFRIDLLFLILSIVLFKSSQDVL